jgi:hypothetical protein
MASHGTNLKSAWAFRSGWRSGPLDLLRPLCMEPKNEPAIWTDWWLGRLVSYVALLGASRMSPAATGDIRRLREMASRLRAESDVSVLPQGVRRVRRLLATHDRQKLFR